jgi:predicted nucleotidyltransferase
MIDLQPDHRALILRILKQHVPDAEVRVFGSRVTGGAAKYSDIDIAIVDREKLSLAAQAALTSAFEESELPFRVDIVDWHGISGAFQSVIESRHEVIQQARNNA